MHHPRSLSFRVLKLALPLALLAGCAAQPHQTLPTEYRRDAQNCRAQSAKHIEVRMNMAGISTQELDGGMDEDQYLACMQKLGWKQDESTDPLLKAIAKCQAQSERPVQATPEAGGTKLSGSLDRTAFRQCLKQRGFEGDVTIGPVIPANPQ